MLPTVTDRVSEHGCLPRGHLFERQDKCKLKSRRGRSPAAPPPDGSSNSAAAPEKQRDQRVSLSLPGTGEWGGHPAPGTGRKERT